jgi:Protein of unknown function (DUF2804)
MLDALPYRGTFGQPRPPELAHLTLPPNAMPSHDGTRPLKAWRYVGVYGPEIMLCLAQARIGRARQSFWGLWDRTAQRLHQRTALGRGGIRFEHGRAELLEPGLTVGIVLEEQPGIETVCPSGESYAWTRKQAPVRARVVIELQGERRAFEGLAVIDDTAAYYPRYTHWRWSAGVGRSVDGQQLAWNLVSGVNDPPLESERTVWVNGRPREAPPCHFADDLSGVDGLRFEAEEGLSQDQNLLLVRSRYRAPFGLFSGELPEGVRLAEGFGVMEEHEVWW